MEVIMHKLSVIKNPAGTYSFAGSVPYNIAFINPDGSAPTDDQIDTMEHSMSESIGRKLTGLKLNLFDSYASAVHFAYMNGYNVY